MKRLNRDMEAVSPVIATILMVAITVVLAATLYMMVGDIGGEDVGEFFGEASIGDRGTDDDENIHYVRVDMDTMSPSSVDVNDVTVELYDQGDEYKAGLEGETLTEETEEGYNLRWTRLTGGDVDTTSRLYVEVEDGIDDISGDGDLEGYEVVITVSGRSGSIEIEL